MIHTMTIQHQIPKWKTAQIIAETMGASPERIRAYLYPNPSPRKKTPPSIRIKPTIPGYQEMSLYHRIIYNRDTMSYGSQYFLYLRLEPLTVINREQHIDVFDCYSSNYMSIVEQFRSDMLNYFGLKATEHGDDFLIETLPDLMTWSVQRVDYTMDVKMKDHDEVLAFVNLAKMSALSNSITSSEHNSIYGENFYDSSFQVENNSWQFQIYDKEAQFSKKKDVYPREEFQRLLTESQDVVRIEYRLLPAGVQAITKKKFPSKNIAFFLNEFLAEKLLYDCYERTVGFENFYRAYHAWKKLATAFPITKEEARAENKRKKEAAKKGMRYKPRKHGKKFENYRAFLIDIMKHKGLQNAYDAALSGLTGTARAAADAKFKRWLSNIRERAHISPVLIPDNWKNRKKLDIPNDYLPNPVKRPEA